MMYTPKFNLGDSVYYISPSRDYSIENIRNTFAKSGVIHTIALTPGNMDQYTGGYSQAIVYTMEGLSDQIPERFIDFDGDTVVREFFEKVVRRKEKEIDLLKQELLKNTVNTRTPSVGMVSGDQDLSALII